MSASLKAELILGHWNHMTYAVTLLSGRAHVSEVTSREMTEVFTLPPYSTWNPCGLHMESMLFHMESAHFTWNMFWLRSHPFW